MDLTDEQWTVLEPALGTMPRRADGRGRPWRSSREVFNGILWILRTGAQWAELPAGYPPYQTFHRCFQRGVRDGTLERVLEAFARDLKERGKVDLAECFIDGTFIVAKKGGDAWGRPSAAKGRSSWPWQTAPVFRSPSVPPRPRLTRAPSSLPPFDSRFVNALPERLIGDRAYDADPLDDGLAALGIELIAPHRRGRTRPKTQDGRPLAASVAARRSSGSSPGSATSAASSSATNTTRSITSASSSSAASSSCSARRYDATSASVLGLADALGPPEG